MQHYVILRVLCNTIQISEDLYRRTDNFINNCQSGKCKLVQNVTHHDVFFSVMISPIGWNVFVGIIMVYYCVTISEVNTSIVCNVATNNIGEDLQAFGA